MISPFLRKTTSIVNHKVRFQINFNAELSLLLLTLFSVLLCGLVLLMPMKWATSKIMKMFLKLVCSSTFIQFVWCFHMNFSSILLSNSSFIIDLSQAQWHPKLLSADPVLYKFLHFFEEPNIDVYLHQYVSQYLFCDYICKFKPCITQLFLHLLDGKQVEVTLVYTIWGAWHLSQLLQSL